MKPPFMLICILLFKFRIKQHFGVITTLCWYLVQFSRSVLLVFKCFLNIFSKAVSLEIWYLNSEIQIFLNNTTYSNQKL